MARNTKTTDGTYTRRLDVFYDGAHHEVATEDVAWHLALKHAPARITEIPADAKEQR